MKYKPHPFADLFPMMSEVELDALAADIAEQGLQQPIVLYEGDVLDGRNRLAACERAGVEPTFATYQGDDPLGLVISLNLRRRHLVPHQRAIAAARSLPLFKDEAEKRAEEGRKRGGEEGGRGRPKEKVGADSRHQPNGRKSRDEAAAVFEVNKEYIQQAKLILAEAPTLADEVFARRLTLDNAYARAKKAKEAREEKEAEDCLIVDYLDQIAAGEMTRADAVAIVKQRQEEEDKKHAAEADARQSWLTGLVEVIDWVETYISTHTDEHLAWYTLPNSRGQFDHGMTAPRVRAAIDHLQRTLLFAFEGDAGDAKTPQ